MRFALCSRCFALCLLLGGAALPASAAPPAYTVRDLGPLPTCSDDIAPGLDAAGAVAAWAAGADDAASATLCRPGGTPAVLPALPGYPLAYAAGVSGPVVCGVARTPADLRPSRAVAWQGGQARDLGTLGGPYAAAHAVNPRGQIAGSAQTPSGDTHAALWPAGGGPAQDLGTLGQGTYSTASGLNAAGDVVGAAAPAPSGKVHGFLWHAGKMGDLGTLPFGALSNARAINTRGDIAGWGELPGGALHAVLWQGGRCRDLGTLGDEPSAAWGLNDRGEVVGTSAVKAGRTHAFVWNGVMRDLNALIPAGSGWILTAAYRINTRGQIVGRGFHGGVMRLALLTPVARPAARQTPPARAGSAAR